MSYFLFDIGGTNMRGAISHDGVAFSEPKIIPTPKDFTAGMRALKNLATDLTGSERITAVGGGIAGTLSGDRSVFLNGPHLAGWNGKAITQEMTKMFSAPVYIENDTAIVGLGEAVYGKGMKHAIVAYITVSTGVGGVRIVNKMIDVSRVGFEPGHQIIDAGRGMQVSGVGGYGVDLEGHISGTAITDRYGKKPYEITDEKFWDEMARLLAYGLNNTIVHWSPDIVILGGSMMKKIGIPVDRVRAHLRGILHIYPELPIIEHAGLGDIGGIYGALAYINQKHTNNS